MRPPTPDTLRKDHAEEARATALLVADEVEAAARDILHFTRQRLLKLGDVVLARGKELESVIRQGGET